MYLEHFERHGEWPTVREAGAALGIGSPNGLMCHLKSLELKGYLAREPLSSRGTRVIRDADGREVRVGIVRQEVSDEAV